MKPRIKFPRSEKVYLSGNIYPELRVAMRKVEQVPSTTFVGEEKVITPNPDIYIYDTSGPFSDPDIEIDLKKGLPRLREPWILRRDDVEQLPEITSEYGRMRRDDKSLDHLRFEHISLPYRAKQGKCCTQMYYAKQGIITPEMEYELRRIRNRNAYHPRIRPPRNSGRACFASRQYQSSRSRTDDYRP